MDFRQALQEAEAFIGTIDGVEGVGEGECDGEQCITVFISLEMAREKLPKTLQGYKIVVESTDEFSAL